MRNMFGWSYPAGCSGTPADDEPPIMKEEENILGILEEAGVEQEVSDRVIAEIEKIKEIFMNQLDEAHNERIRDQFLAKVRDERRRQLKLFADQDARLNSPNDFVAFITAYAGRAAQNCPRNEKEGNSYPECMIKVAALAMAAYENWGRLQA